MSRLNKIETSLDVIKLAYKKLKRAIYYDKNDLFLRKGLAEFEADPKLEERFKEIVQVANSDSPKSDEVLTKWLEKVSFRLVPKSVEIVGEQHSSSDDKERHFISNVTTGEKYRVPKVNYFF